MELELQDAVAIIAIATTVLAGLLGLLFDRKPLSALMLVGLTAVASGLCYAGTRYRDETGLAIAILAVAFLAFFVARNYGGSRGSIFVPALWLGYCASCAIGYYAAGLRGLLMITLPSLIVFWGAMYLISGCLMPLRDRKQRGNAFRALITYSLGTNYPFHVMGERELEERVEASPFSMFFAGPGIVLTGVSHAPVVWTGLEFRKVEDPKVTFADPGLTFTGRFEAVYQTVDLRPQLSSFLIEAVAKDGIRVRVATYVTFKLFAGKEQPALGTSFPLDKKAVYKAVWAQPVERGERRSWDEVVPIAATRLMRRMIARFRFDELGEPLDPSKDPRAEIQKGFLKQLRREVRDDGIDVLDCWIGNLQPVDGQVTEERIKAWRAEWQRKIMDIEGKAQANAIAEVERAHARAQAEMISAIGNIVKQHQGVDPAFVADMAALRFIEALEEMASQPEVQQELPPEAVQTMAYLRRRLD
jgi:regulator of protease activity HflC (stomatin/prohibitin superfamily)